MRRYNIPCSTPHTFAGLRAKLMRHFVTRTATRHSLKYTHKICAGVKPSLSDRELFSIFAHHAHLSMTLVRNFGFNAAGCFIIDAHFKL